MKKIEVPFHFTEFDQLIELSEQEQKLVSLARQMTHQSYAPYSGFFVGAAVLLENGEIVKGSNQENAAYPSGLCAERVAVFSASAQHPGVNVVMVAISARSSTHVMDHPVTPCGACRQVLLEYEFKQEKPVRLILSGEKGKILVVDKVKDLLPLSFTPDELL
jgi:cytidine deaminase